MTQPRYQSHVLCPELNAPPKEEDRPITETAKKAPRKSLLLPLSPDPDIENVADDSDTELPDLQVPVRVFRDQEKCPTESPRKVFAKEDTN